MSSPNLFGFILNEFPSSMNIAKPLCRRIKAILFGDDGRLNLATPEDSNLLYDALLDAFRDTLRLMC